MAQGKNTTKGHGCIAEVFGIERIHGIFVSYAFVFVLIVEARRVGGGVQMGIGIATLDNALSIHTKTGAHLCGIGAEGSGAASQGACADA